MGNVRCRHLWQQHCRDLLQRAARIRAIQQGHGFLYNGSTYTTLDYPGSSQTFARGISGGNIVGSFDDSAGAHGFLYNGTSYTSLDDPLGTQGTFAYGISGGNIVGYFNDSAGTFHGFLYNGSTYTTLDDPLGTQGTEAYGISGNNIVGGYTDASGVGHGFLAAVPEPATFMFAALGFLSVIAWRRRW